MAIVKEEKKRDFKLKSIDISAAKALIQAAVNVELFTIPLYMTSMYSIHGMHQVTSKGTDFYQGRLWPGSSKTAYPDDKNKEAFNIIFSVFIQEMLHLQLAANIASSMGVEPCFTSEALQTPDNGWKCYGDNITVIPHILDFKDTKEPYQNIKVKLDSLNKEQIKLFLAIEEPEEVAIKRIREDCLHKYFPKVPFKNWKENSTENDLPMFGSIGVMYQCLWDYLELEYSDGTNLWESVYDAGAVQRDMFNTGVAGHPYKEYPDMPTTFNGWLPDKAFDLVYDMICSITDQGEGAGISRKIRNTGLRAVKKEYRPSKEALAVDYPSYSDTGCPIRSSSEKARFSNDADDHYERFLEIQKDLKNGEITTWDQWHAQNNKWNGNDLKTEDYDKNRYKDVLPSPDDVAGALNRLKQNNTDKNFELFSKTSVGAIAGITRVLNSYWLNYKIEFPYPSMVGSGDRISICWAVFGKAPDLSLGINRTDPNKLYHGCQGLSLSNPGNDCAAIEVFHTCRGSNTCAAQGGCGYVQQVGTSGGGCGGGVSTPKKSSQVLCGQPSQPLYSAPSDNSCAGQGGCAVPISASQLFPATNDGRTENKMELNDFNEDNSSVKIGTLDYEKGDDVHDIAWQAYEKVMAYRKQNPGKKLPPNDLRLAFPPST